MIQEAGLEVVGSSAKPADFAAGPGAADSCVSKVRCELQKPSQTSHWRPDRGKPQLDVDLDDPNVAEQRMRLQSIPAHAAPGSPHHLDPHAWVHPGSCWGLPHCFSTGMPQTPSWIGLKVQLCASAMLPPTG